MVFRRPTYASVVLLVALLLAACNSTDDESTESGGDDDGSGSGGGTTPTALFDPLPANGTAQLAGYQLRSRWQKTDLTYHIYSFAPSIPTGEQQTIFQEAFAAWAAVTPLTFTEVGSLGQADMLIGFGATRHCELYQVRSLQCPEPSRQNPPFEGSGGLLAHAYFPGQGALSGESHFDDGERWTPRGGGTSLLSVAMHEIGHALGLEHSSDPNALMFNEYRFPIESLQPDDIAGIQALYGNANGSTPPDEVPPPPVEPPTVSGCGPSGFGDADGDGIDDATEQFWLGTDPFNCDTDGDGLPDSEVFSGLDPRNPDTDFDGVSDGEEVAIGSNPFFPDQGSPTGIVAGYYLGQDSFGSRLEILVSPNGFAEGALTVPGPFGPVSIPLVGGADALGQLSLVSYDNFFSLVGVPVPGGLQGELYTLAGGFSTWAVGFAGASRAEASDVKDVPARVDPAEIWEAYQPRPENRKAMPAVRRLE